MDYIYAGMTLGPKKFITKGEYYVLHPEQREEYVPYKPEEVEKDTTESWLNWFNKQIEKDIQAGLPNDSKFKVGDTIIVDKKDYEDISTPTGTMLKNCTQGFNYPGNPMIVYNAADLGQENDTVEKMQARAAQWDAEHPVPQDGKEYVMPYGMYLKRRAFIEQKELKYDEDGMPYLDLD